MFLTREEVIIRDAKKILYALGFATVTLAFVILMMLMFIENNEIYQWLFGM